MVKPVEIIIENPTSVALRSISKGTYVMYDGGLHQCLGKSEHPDCVLLVEVLSGAKYHPQEDERVEPVNVQIKVQRP